MTATLMTPAARSHSLGDSAAVTARRILCRDSTSSCPRSRRALVITHPARTPRPRCPARGPPRPQRRCIARSRGRGVRNLRGRNSQRWRRSTWMIGGTACGGIVSESIWLSTARIARTFSCSVLRIEGVFRRMFDALRGGNCEESRDCG